MKVQYLAAVAAASVLGLGTLASCTPDTTVETDPVEDVEVDPCAADPCAADPCAADPCAAE
ncbi:hypothetical protein [cf. Phormidesmis sp. LEGE 11477]|uniref:hypothetical protein n=1 Tax=cf. Phormidesmis sp. LEGE 11477 TaxID=1828680 RepID=UPI00188253CC|nr:hypothetical protein [cf. Phormidesmis sp. LEGE 11477]MBE9062024.1 hypothetical protein [cf. Phormidesmis sp. LEGE 11477]